MHIAARDGYVVVGNEGTRKGGEGRRGEGYNRNFKFFSSYYSIVDCLESYMTDRD